MFSTSLDSKPMLPPVSIRFFELVVRIVRCLHAHAENTGSTSDIKNDLVLEDVAVLVDRVAVGSCADIIFL